ncbi:MAG: hypothetical protein WEF86_01020 [Gemmatimonadota bacterium]
MRANWYVAMAAGLVMAAAVPEHASAQLSGRVNDRARDQARQGDQRASQQEQRERELERDRIRRQRERQAQNARQDERYRDERYRYDTRSSRGGGPSFCRSGEGHPVFGREWCRDKGFDLGSDRTLRGVLGGRDRDQDRDYNVWEDIILGRQQDRRDDRSLGRSVLQDVLGSVVLGRFESIGRQHGSGAINGQWLMNGAASVLQLNAGSVLFAQLVDINRDGRVDDVIFR